MKEWLKENIVVILNALMLVGIVSIIVIFIAQKKPDYSLFEYQLKQARDSAKLYQPTIDSLTKVINQKEDKDYAHIDSVLHQTIEATNKTIYELRKSRQAINTDSLYSKQLAEYFSKIN